jgi:ADP-heptose:LPS heptosyltransferase
MIFRLADRAVLLTVRRAPRRGIAIITPHGLGDLLLFTEAFRHLSAHHRGEPVLLVCSNVARSFAEAYLKPDRIIALDRGRMRRDPWYRARNVRAVARAAVRAAIQPAYNREHMIEDALIRASRAQERIGSSGAPMFMTARERARGDLWYTRLIEEPPDPMHDAERNAAFAAALTGSPPPRLMPRLAHPPRHPDVPAGGYIVVACEASEALKSWPRERFTEASLAIAARTGLAVVLVGETKLSRRQADSVVVDLSGLTDMLARTDMRGLTDMHGLISILAHARIVFCNDSAPAHLAAALGVPVVAVGGGGMPGRYLPYPASEPDSSQPHLVAVDPPWPCFACGWQCHYAPPRDAAAPCVANVSVRKVVHAALTLLRASVVGSS